RYFIRVRSVDADGVAGPYGPAQVTDVRPRPAPPTALFVVAGPGKSAELKWQPAESGMQHHLQISPDAAFKTLIFDEHQIESTSFIVPATLPPAVYRWRVAASTKADGEGEFSEVSLFRISPDAPSLSTIATVQNHLLFGWREQPGSAQYQIEVAADAAFRDVLIDQRTKGVTLQAPRLAGGRYFARIRSIDADGVPGAYSNTSSFQVPTRFPLWLLLPLLIII